MRHFVFKSPSVLNVNTESPGCDCSEGLRCVGDDIVNREDHLAALCRHACCISAAWTGGDTELFTEFTKFTKTAISNVSWSH